MEQKLNETVWVKWIDGTEFRSDMGSRSNIIDMGVTLRDGCLEIGNFGWNYKAVHVCNHKGYTSPARMRSAVVRMLHAKGLEVLAWGEENRPKERYYK